MKLKKKQKETILLPTNADINDEKIGPSAVRRITNKRIPLPGGRERRKEPLAGNRVFRVTSVKGCPDATHPAYCPLTSVPAPDI